MPVAPQVSGRGSRPFGAARSRSEHAQVLQESYFVIGDLDELLELARIDFAPLYARLDSGPEYQPGDVLPTDRVVSRGDGSYHAAKRAK
jgi:phenylalanine-4-hydroxylase